MNMIRQVTMDELVGLTFTSVTRESGVGDEVHFYTENGDLYKMFHEGECCEVVDLEDVCGDLEDLVGSPILIAREAVSDNMEDAAKQLLPPEDYVMHKLSTTAGYDDDIAESQTWTFYLISTIKGSVTLRWYGTSNGCYSESVDIEKMWVDVS